ncbi:ParB N-terminal domain-containing protein [Nocardia sp. 348MFTsu5.1]|uniref:ParB/RepB/Spo0J family partition protein n=1 Tax=Nocardia sp. 348MFTsu5.1 TaxID=1172185 RepID=UPI000376E19D|nr:ParB N-terminal domain-containing protein [Nocardia sp. 348MFTsu5.1]
MTNNTATAVLAVNAGVLEHLNPAELAIDDNVRTDAAIDADFIASIATGVRQPVYAVRDSEGVVKVRDGQRRTLAARDAGLTTIPVYVVDAEDTEADDTERTRRRIIDQVIANEARADLKPSEKAAAVEQLSLTGLSATKIAKSLHTSKKTVDAALATAGSDAARQAVDAANLTLEQGMVLAQYDDDADAITELVEAAAEGRFDHKAAELAENAPARAAIAAARDELTAQGYTVITDRPSPSDGYRRLDQYVDAEGTAAAVADCDPEHLVAYLSAQWHSEYTCADGEIMEVDDIDWDLDEDDADAQPEDGLVDPRKVTKTETATAAVIWFHTRPDAAGLLTTWEWSQNNPRKARPSSGGQSQDQPVSEAEQARKDAESAARKQTIALNKLAVAAQTVRRTKLREVLSRKSLPKGKSVVVAAFQANTMWRNADLYNLSRQDADAKKLAAELLGTDPMEAIAEATGERGQVIALAITLAAHEANLPKDSWRGGHEYFRSVGEGRTRYLQFLTEAYGYQHADIEKVITGELSADDIDIV